MGSVIIDGPGLLLQGSILIISIIAIFLIADTENFAAAAAALHRGAASSLTSWVSVRGFLCAFSDFCW